MENGNVMLMSYYPHDSDLTALGGSPNASVIDLIIQELDPADNVVFEWSSGDHFDITDMTKQHSITAQTIDYVHGNALDTCDDGNIILSCRHMDEVTKINRTTGDIMWRFGGKDARHHDFEIINDPLGGFSHQHCARWLGNNHILLFDNGNYHSPGMSRAVEYELDEENMTATLVWSYEDGSTWTRFMGSVQRLPDGNTVICWGNHNNVITEVRPDGTKAFEISIPSDMYTYRGFRFEWQADEW
jgi:outer membrane protein assembly factor BamB